uniref:NYN domain-containing protein n=1 Tax=Cupriavidus taiwanensis TaxID=164546 RepID=UPI001F1224E0|nr:NYN domain-containing protein [Cupriavidus taiwanensis]
MENRNTTPSRSTTEFAHNATFKPVKQFAYTSGKNATDGTLIIDAMDLLYTRRLDGFCLVTSDSDFTGLATRIREEGLVVVGFGEQKTPDAFRNACNKFVLTELLRPAPAAAIPAAAAKPEPIEVPIVTPANIVAKAPVPSFPQDFMLSALDQSSDENGWAHLGTFGSYLMKLQPDFDPWVYGFKKLSELVRSRQDIFVDRRAHSARSNSEAAVPET